MFDFIHTFNYLFNEFAYVYFGFYNSDDLDSIGHDDSSSSTDEDTESDISISNSELESDILLLSQLNEKLQKEQKENDYCEEEDEDLEYESNYEEEYVKAYKDVFERNVKLVSIEGNIGAGKSTLVKTLQNRYSDRDDIYFLQEPVDLWEKIKDKDGKNMLQKFYANPKKYAFAFPHHRY
jgi:ABC-type glutathione transport system ATPase component